MSDIQFLETNNEHNLPISKAAVAGDYFFTWGYGEVVEDDDPKAGMRKVFDHLADLLAQKGLDFSDVVKVTGLLVKTSTSRAVTKFIESNSASRIRSVPATAL